MTGIVEVFILRSQANDPELVINNIHKNHGEFNITKVNKTNTVTSEKNNVRGLFRIENFIVDNKYILKKTLKVGQAFGEKEMFKNQKRCTIAIAADENTEIIQISKKS